jgi:Phytanoyl-CoA dioxygenase (PhyH)
VSDERLLGELDRHGWVLVPDVVGRDLCARLIADLEHAHLQQREMQLANGVGGGTDGTVHHLPLRRGAFLEFLDGQPLGTIVEQFFGRPCILNTFGGVLNLPENLSYVGRIHRDLRTFSGDTRLMLQWLVMLDAFTEENGATYLLNGSHRFKDAPAEADFFEHASRAIGPAGSIVLFNSNLWHAAGVNRSAQPRRALTLAFTPPFMKQQLDYPRAMGYDGADLFSPVLRQLFGYNARVPASLDEWYQPPERRLYRKDQG